MTAAAIARVHRAAAEWQGRQACATCGDRCAPFTCAWLCDMPTRIHAGRASVGDAWVTSPRGKIGRISLIEYFDEQIGFGEVRLEMSGPPTGTDNWQGVIW